MNKIIIRLLTTMSMLSIVVGTLEAFGPLMKVYAAVPETTITISPVSLTNEIAPKSPQIDPLEDSEIIIEAETLIAPKATLAEPEDDVTQEYEMVYAGDFLATAYCCEKYEHICGEGHGITKSGEPVKAELTVAADWSVLPEGTWIYIEDVGIRQVQDIGGSIKNMRIDVAVDTHENALKWSGYGTHKVYILPGYSPTLEETKTEKPIQ